MTGRERRLLRMLCMTAGSGGGGGGGGGDDGGDKPFDELTWDQVIASTKTGKYKTFTVGAMKELDLGTEGIVRMQIVGIDADDLADGSGKAPLTFISKELLTTRHRMNPTLSPSSAPYDEGTGAIGGWEKCEMRTYLKNTVKLLIPENVRNSIVDVTKYSRILDTSGASVNNAESVDDVWIPSAMEIFGGVDYETLGHFYGDVFYDDNSRKKARVGTSNSVVWWLRTASLNFSINTGFRFVYGTGLIGETAGTNSLAFPLGFCL